MPRQVPSCWCPPLQVIGHHRLFQRRHVNCRGPVIRLIDTMPLLQVHELIRRAFAPDHPSSVGRIIRKEFFFPASFLNGC